MSDPILEAYVASGFPRAVAAVMLHNYRHRVFHQQHKQAAKEAAAAILTNDVLKPHSTFTCPICLNPESKARKFVMMVKCEHVLHKTCAQILFKTQCQNEIPFTKCPVCRADQT